LPLINAPALLANAQEARIYTKDSKIFVSGVEIVFPEEKNATVSQMLADAAAVSSAIVSLSTRSSTALAALAGTDRSLAESFSVADAVASAQIAQVKPCLRVSHNHIFACVSAHPHRTFMSPVSFLPFSPIYLSRILSNSRWQAKVAASLAASSSTAVDRITAVNISLRVSEQKQRKKER
jgi:hypothetical protein